jgi:hypothetical protein
MEIEYANVARVDGHQPNNPFEIKTGMSGIIEGE